MLKFLSVFADEKKKFNFKLKSINASWELVTHYPCVSVYKHRETGSASFTITFILPVRDSEVFFLSADWVSLC